jgi:penicillin-binding protein 2
MQHATRLSSSPHQPSHHQPSQIHQLLWKRVLVVMLLTLLLAGCDAAAQVVANSSGSNAGNTEADSAVTQAPVDAPSALTRQGRSTPEEAARAFLEAWDAQRIEEMYQLVSARSEEFYPFADFRAEYSLVQSTTAFAGLEYTIRNVREQGNSADVTYDVTLESSTFGSIQDTERTMRLMQEGNQWYIAWTPGDILNGYATGVRLRPERLFPQRASIYDRNGNPLAQENATVLLVRVRKQDMSNVNDCARLLAEVMLRSTASIQSLFVGYNDDTLFRVGEISRETYNANRAEMDSICGTNIPVPELNNAQKVVSASGGRDYYGHGAATHVTGYIGRVPQDQLSLWQSRGYTETDIVGLAGIEGAYQDTLAGRPEQVLRLIDPAGMEIRVLGSAEGQPPTGMTLTIDRELQRATMEAFNDAFNYARINWAAPGLASGGAAVVLDVNTGEVLAMASYPTFDPRLFDPNSTYGANNLLGDVVNDPRQPLRNKAIQEQYFPGSTFKIVTLLAAADAGLWAPGEIFNCELRWTGQERFGDAPPIREDWRVVFEEDPAGEVTMAEALTASCNPFFFEMGALLFQQRNDLLAEYAELLGFGRPTGLGSDLGVTEAGGSIPRPNDVTSVINNAVGQGDVKTSAAQMAQMVAAIANGGTLYEPYIVQSIGGVDGQPLRERREPTVIRDLTDELSATALEVTREGMCDVPVTELGTGYYVFGEGNEEAGAAPYTSCGKTGSAQAGPPESNIPPNSWYVAYAPRENPEIAIAVVVPTSREGSEVAAPITRRIMDNYFNAPIAPFPEWWEEEYEPVPVPRGLAGLEEEEEAENDTDGNQGQGQ